MDLVSLTPFSRAHDNRCSVPLPPGRTTRPKVGQFLGMAKGTGHGAKIQPLHSKPILLFGITRPFPSTKVAIIAASGVINPVRGKSNKQTADTTHIFPRSQPPHTRFWSSCQVHPREPGSHMLCTLPPHPQGPPSLLQTLFSCPHSPGPMALTYNVGDPRAG